MSSSESAGVLFGLRISHTDVLRFAEKWGKLLPITAMAYPSISTKMEEMNELPEQLVEKLEKSDAELKRTVRRYTFPAVFQKVVTTTTVAGKKAVTSRRVKLLDAVSMYRFKARTIEDAMAVWSKSMALPNPVTVASMNAMGKRLQAVFSTKEPLEVKLWSFNDIF